MTEQVKSKVQMIEERADTAYNRQDQEWFDTAPLDHLAVLWGVACARLSGASWDDEVFEALDKRGWFADIPEPEGDGLLCILCRYIGLTHDGDHIVPGPKVGT